MRYWLVGFRLFCMCLLFSHIYTDIARGQLTAKNANGSATTNYINTHNTFDTIFVFNQVNGPKKGNLSLTYRPPSTIEWLYKAVGDPSFKPYKTFTNTISQMIDTLRAGDYQINIKNGLGTKTTPVKVEAIKNADDSYTVTVTANGSKDVFIHAEPKGRYTAVVEAPSCTYKWYRFNYQSRSFGNTAFATVTGTSTRMDTLSQGGYKVSVQTGSITDSFVAWLYMNPGFNLSLQKNDDGAVGFRSKNCDFTNFFINANIPIVQSSFVYYDPQDGDKGMLDNKITFHMQKGTGSEVQTSLYQQGSLQYFRDSDPPTSDMRFYFKGKDLFGIEKKDDILYETILPKAEFTAKKPSVDPESAPVEVRFASQSVNAVEYFWRFGDGDSAIYNLSNLLPDTVSHTYYLPQNPYTAVLIVKSIYQCTDSVSEKIIVKPSTLDVANVFTPNGDNLNDYFKPYNVSIRQFEISIFARSGKRVYHYKGDDLRSWEGWDGRIQNGGKDAAEGVYFYMIKAIGWDYPKLNKNANYTFSGSVHLYR